MGWGSTIVPIAPPGGPGADCDDALVNDTLCATVNSSPDALALALHAQGTGPRPGHTFLAGSFFFEGGVNLADLFPVGDLPCFSSFMAETRASTSIHRRSQGQDRRQTSTVQRGHRHEDGRHPLQGRRRGQLHRHRLEHRIRDGVTWTTSSTMCWAPSP